MAKQNKSAINLSRESARQEQPRLASKMPPQFKKAKKAYNPETINSEIEMLNKSRSMNGEEVREFAKAAKERGKVDGFFAGVVVVTITWASNSLISWVMKNLEED